VPQSFVNNMHFVHFRRDLVAPFASRRSVGLLVTLAGLAGVTGPFGTFDAYPAVVRYLYWLAVVTSTAAVGHASVAGFERILRQYELPSPLELAAIAGLSALPVCLVVALVSLAFGFKPFDDALPKLYLQCVAVMGGIVVVFHLCEAQAPEVETAEMDRVPALLRRLPPAKRGRLLRLSAQDHYVEVITDRGHTLIAMRFRDAIAEAAAEPGLQCHRSHWVARHAISEAGRQDNRCGLKLACGTFIPVGRTFRPAVKIALGRADRSHEPARRAKVAGAS